MKTKLLVILGVCTILIIFSLPSCINCGKDAPKFVKVIGFEWGIYEIHYADSMESKLTIKQIENDSVNFSNFAIILDSKQEYFGQSHYKKGFSLFQSAYACDPALPDRTEQINSISIFSPKDFDQNYPAGSDLADLFDATEGGFPLKKYNLKDYIQMKPIVPDRLYLILKSQPATNNDFQFQVKYFQNGNADNNYFEYATPNVVITRD